MSRDIKPLSLVGASTVLTLCTQFVAAEALPPVDQLDLNAMITEGEAALAFETAFEAGDELTEFSFTADRGVGANIGEGRIFTRFPRADLAAPGEWATHFPKREGGANATSCIACHNAPLANGAGDIALNVVVDPDHTGDPTLYLERNTLPLFALGIPQKLAEEMTVELQDQKMFLEASACQNGSASMEVMTKGVSFGTLAVTRTTQDPCTVEIDTAALEGIDDDLVVKPFGWKGNEPTIRSFTRGAAHNELGLQAVELVGAEDSDFDGVINELTVGDMTALAIYMAALERPVSTLELAALDLVEMTAAEASNIEAGTELFAQAECSSCHVSEMHLADTVFLEPSRTPGFHDVAFPDGSDPNVHGLTQVTPVRFDLAADQPNNQVETDTGEIVHLGALRTDDQGRAIANWFTDFKRHDMGADLSDPADPLGVGASMFLTRSLAGVGSTGPWLHDGRATTLDAAILAHGGDAAASRDLYQALDDTQRAQIVSFLESLVIVHLDDEEEH